MKTTGKSFCIFEEGDFLPSLFCNNENSLGQFLISSQIKISPSKTKSFLKSDISFINSGKVLLTNSSPLVHIDILLDLFII